MKTLRPTKNGKAYTARVKIAFGTDMGVSPHGENAKEFVYMVEAGMLPLEAIRAAASQWPGTVIPTFLGAHVVPPEYSGRSQSYVEIVCKEMLPAVAKRKLAKFVDVFCDRGAFSEIECSTIFGAALEHGFAVRAHLGQLSSPKAGFIEATLECCRPTSFDHMDYVRDHEVTALAKSDTVVTFVPGANYFLGLAKYPPARKYIDAGVAVALATIANLDLKTA